MLSSRQYSSDLQEKKFEHPLMDYTAQVRKSANLHIQDGRHGLICIFKIDMNSLQSSYASDFRDFFSKHPLMDYPT